MYKYMYLQKPYILGHQLPHPKCMQLQCKTFCSQLFHCKAELIGTLYNHWKYIPRSQKTIHSTLGPLHLQYVIRWVLLLIMAFGRLLTTGSKPMSSQSSPEPWMILRSIESPGEVRSLTMAILPSDTLLHC